MRVMGPYIYPSGSCEGRKFVVICNDDGERIRQTLYSRWLMEQSIGYELPRSLHVHHINEDKTDDRIDNLEIKKAGDHAREHALGKVSPLKGVELGWTHGTIYGWMKKKCQCVQCVDAKREWNDERNLRRREEGGSQRGSYRPRQEHGYSRYRLGCRCDTCRQGHTEYRRNQRQKKKGKSL